MFRYVFKNVIFLLFINIKYYASSSHLSKRDRSSTFFNFHSVTFIVNIYMKVNVVQLSEKWPLTSDERSKNVMIDHGVRS